MIIEVNNLNRVFGDLKAVNNISFQVKKGEIFAFLGPNGAGKTTTIKMLTTLLRPTSGRINIAGIDSKKDKEKVRESIGIIFQDQSLDEDLTAYENMQFHAVVYHVPKKIAKVRIEELLKFVGLWERKNSMVRTFSGGMKRRLEIARGLIHHPKVLFLDEPTLGLDPQTRNQIWEYIVKLNKKEKMTVFFTTHYMEEADKVATRISIMDVGKIILTGTSKEIKRKTKAKTLEDAFLKLTGKAIRDEVSSSQSRMRIRRKLWRK